ELGEERGHEREGREEDRLDAAIRDRLSDEADEQRQDRADEEADEEDGINREGDHGSRSKELVDVGALSLEPGARDRDGVAGLRLLPLVLGDARDTGLDDITDVDVALEALVLREEE